MGKSITVRTGELCTTHYIRKSVLKELVLADLQRVLSFVQSHEQEFIQTANEYNAKAVQRTLAQQRKELDTTLMRHRLRIQAGFLETGMQTKILDRDAEKPR